MNDRYSFDNFISDDPITQMDYDVCKKVAELLGQPEYNPLFIYGEPLLGSDIIIYIGTLLNKICYI